MPFSLPFPTVIATKSPALTRTKTNFTEVKRNNSLFKTEKKKSQKVEKVNKKNLFIIRTKNSFFIQH